MINFSYSSQEKKVVGASGRFLPNLHLKTQITGIFPEHSKTWQDPDLSSSPLFNYSHTPPLILLSQQVQVSQEYKSKIRNFSLMFFKNAPCHTQSFFFQYSQYPTEKLKIIQRGKKMVILLLLLLGKLKSNLNEMKLLNYNRGNQ